MARDGLSFFRHLERLVRALQHRTPTRGKAVHSGTEALATLDTGVETEIKSVISAHYEAVNNRDIEGFKTTLHTQYPNYQAQLSTAQLLFDTHDQTFKIRDIHVTRISEDEAEAKVIGVATSREKRSPQFGVFEMEMLVTLKPEKGKWKIYFQMPIVMEDLKR